VKETNGLRNQLRAIRTRIGLSQQELAAAAGIARQTVGGIEAQLYAPSAAVALRLARALGCRVDEIFWLDDDPAHLAARPAAGIPMDVGQRVAVANIGGEWVAHPLYGQQAFRTELVPADGVIAGAAGDRVRVRLLDDADTLSRTVVIGGCAPALSLWARSAERWYPGLRVQWTHLNSTEALQALARGDVHAAGVHLWDPHSGAYNSPFVRNILPDRRVALVNLGLWEEGLLVRSGNPKAVRGACDLARPDVRIVNREAGAGSRLLLDTELATSRIAPDVIAGYADIVGGHQEIADAVASGAADTGVSTAALAVIYGLDFVPLMQVRYDLAILEERLAAEPVKQLLSTLDHRWVRSQLEILGGYDTSRTGETIIVDPVGAKASA